ncbi:MAG: PDC sensor domain-containing protein, partial [Planctomycetota bacterium]
MSIRNKLLSVLLLAAILPILAIRTVQYFSMSNLRERLDTQMREDLTGQAELELERVAESYAGSLERDSKLIFALLQIQASEAERRLQDEVPDKPGRVISPDTFGVFYRDEPSQLPELVVSELHGQVRADRRFTAEPVSYAQPVTLLVDHGRPEDDALRQADALRLSTMPEVFRQVHDQADDLILWQYIALDIGVHVSYPGKAAFASDYAPHLRPWFVQTMQADQPIIVPPQVDQSTRQIVATFAQPIRDAQGRAIGVAAIDIPYSKVLDNTKVHTDWSEQAGLMFLTPFRPVTNAADRLDPTAQLPAMDDVYIAANLDAQFQVMDPGGPMPAGSNAATIRFDDPDDRRAVLDDLVNRRVGVRRATIGGRDTMIAYGPVSPPGEPPAFAAILAPTAAITAPAEQVIAQVNEQIQSWRVNTGGLGSAPHVLMA